MNEKEVKELARSGEPICSVSGRACECVAGGGCKNREPKLDEPTTQAVRELRTARLYIQAATHRLDDIEAPYEMSRRFPGPEVREIRRKLVTAIAMIDEIGGDL